MIELTTLKGVSFHLNMDLIYRIDQVPDTIITLTDGKKLWVQETPQEVVAKVRDWRRSLSGREIDVGTGEEEA